MVDCCYENIYYRKKRKNKRRKFLVFFLILIIFLSLFLYFKFVVSKQIENICSSYVKEVMSETLNGSILKSVSNNVEYDDLITIEKNSSGEVVLINTNAKNLNKLSRDISFFSSAIIKEKLSQGVPIPILAFTGVEILSSLGKKVNLSILSFNSINCEYQSKFEGVGINQSLHKITCVIKCETFINFPFQTNSIVEEYEIFITETVIVGKVPNNYINGNLFR